MTALYQRLKELSEEEFESLLDQLLQAKYPSAGIMRVDGTGGDEGIDNFQGNLTDGPAVWQHKRFANRIHKAQRKQVLKAVAAAFKGRTPRHWVLCVPINLRTTEHNWFQQSAKMPYERRHPGSTIELMQASHIVKDLLHFKTVCDAFFPDAVSDVAELKALVMNTESLSVNDRGKVAAEYARQYLVSMKALDPRCTYDVSIGGEQAPTFKPEPGLLMTFRRGELLTRVFARDLEAIRLDPIGFQLKVQPSAAEKIRQAAETGRPQTLLADEVLGIRSESPLFAFASKGLNRSEITIQPQVPEPAKLVPLRFVFGQRSDAKEIPYLPFKQKYVGQKEVTLTSCGQLPLDMCIKLHLDEGATIQITPMFTAANVCDLQHLLDCLRILKVSPFIEVSSVEFGVPILSGPCASPVAPVIEDRFYGVISDLALISRHFGVELKLPTKITDADLHAVLELRRVATGEMFDVETLDGTLVKEEGPQEQVVMAFGTSAGAIVFQPQSDPDPVELFGVAINIGRPVFKCEEASLANPGDVKRRYAATRPGEVVPITWKCRGKCRFISDQTIDEVMSAPHTDTK